MHDEIIVPNTSEDQAWADLLAPIRRGLITGSTLAAAGMAAGGLGARAAYAQSQVPLGDPNFRPILPPRDIGKGPWGDKTALEPAAPPLRTCWPVRRRRRWRPM